ncbi:pyridoxal-phosphate dependent enzyme [Paracoccaceae bacterium]|jgi:threonine dehydratase|nr:pyridoxal-phosphate dependent enzyme [Paracoccaceae bacterium]|tara:strand:- start:594 stop:1577 length:984 start_codon:yes stop_codon:yes gene_type:complete
MKNDPNSIETIAEKSAIARNRIGKDIFKTPLIPSMQHGSKLLFKAENFQDTGSFKIRGALSKLTALAENENLSELKFITASSGNHGIASSKAASILGASLTVVLPETVAKIKLERIKSFGVTVLIKGAESGQAELYAQKLSKDEGYYYISPYNDPDVIAGQGTIGLEILEQMDNKPIDNLFISIGGGGLISGISAVIKNHSPGTKVWGISAKNSCTLADSIKAGEMIETEHFDTLADGCAGGVDRDTMTLPITQKTVDELIWCEEEEIEDCFRSMAFEEHQIVEGSAALALAGFQQVQKRIWNQNSIVLLCGANIDVELAKKLLVKS